MKKLIFAILMMAMLTSCGSGAATPIAITPNPSAPPNDAFVTTSCATIYPTLPDKAQFKGSAVLDDYKLTSHLFLKHLENGSETDLSTPDDTVSDIRISPDHKTAAYQIGNPKTNQWSLMVADANGVRKSEYKWPTFYTLGNWINNDNILMMSYPPFVVFNPSTKQQEKSFDYPDFPTYSLDKPNNYIIALNPTLDRAIYKSSNDRASLYDIPNKKIIATVDNHPNPSVIASWAPDGSQAAVVGSIMLTTQLSDRSEDLFGMTPSGQVKRLTHLTDHYGKRVQFSKAGLSWSPDSRYVAFWMINLQNGYKYWELGVADVTTQKTTAYCIANQYENKLNSTHYLSAPAWSPDGKQLLLENRYDEESSRVLILDLATSNAYQIEDNKYPGGWIIP